MRIKAYAGHFQTYSEKKREETHYTLHTTHTLTFLQPLVWPGLMGLGQGGLKLIQHFTTLQYVPLQHSFQHSKSSCGKKTNKKNP